MKWIPSRRLNWQGELRLLLGISLAIVLASCQSAATNEDKRRLELVRSQFGGSYEISFDDPHYLRVQSKKGRPSTQELHAIYRSFWTTDEKVPRSGTGFVYLNAYDATGEWTVQLMWDPAQSKVIEQRLREHY